VTFTEMHRKSHVSNDHQQWQHRKATKENNKTHDTDDAATVCIEIHTCMNWT
jgi:hypothetical protein